MTQFAFRTAGPIQLPVLLSGVSIDFMLAYFESHLGSYYALIKGFPQKSDLPLVRVHSACNIAHIFSSQRCDCQPQLELAMQRIHDEGCGLIIYALNHEGRGVGPFDHVRVYQKQDEGYDTYDSYIALGLPVDNRDYSEIAHILQWYGMRTIRLLTNNPKKKDALESMGIHVTRVPLIAQSTRYNQSQIRAKIEKLGHLIPSPSREGTP